MLIDEATVRVRAGRGGNGVISFISNSSNRRGGTDGGNGGNGGSVIFRASSSVSTLYGFQNKSTFHAGDGECGDRKNQQGATGDDEVILVPVGTMIADTTSGEFIADLTSSGDEVIVANGGEGGRGNKSFTNSRRQAPRICERGAKGEWRTVRLELKILADVGIVGYPNAGKSSLVSKISGNNAKVAGYPFTTIIPNLGVVDVDGFKRFVAVDIPGLIDGAHKGKGLGDRFLKHVERTRVLVHVVDLNSGEGRDPVLEYQRLNEELVAFDQKLRRRQQIVVGNKIDIVGESEVDGACNRFKDIGVELLPISAMTGANIDTLIQRTYRVLEQERGKSDQTSGTKRRVYEFEGQEGFDIVRKEETFVVTGKEVELLVEKLVFDSTDAREYLLDRLNRMGVMKELRRQGFSPGSVLQIRNKEFEFVE